jgi:hypothetical protein
MKRSGAQDEIVRMARLTWCSLALAMSLIGLAGCGGGDDSSSGGSSGSSASPAETILTDAGLEVCSEQEEQIAQSTVGAGFQAVRSFAVAKDCAGSETSPNMIRVFQFSSRESVDAGAAALEKKYPRGVVLTSGALVIVATGPDSTSNADAVSKAYEDSTGEPVQTV